MALVYRHFLVRHSGGHKIAGCGVSYQHSRAIIGSWHGKASKPKHPACERAESAYLKREPMALMPSHRLGAGLDASRSPTERAERRFLDELEATPLWT